MLASFIIEDPNCWNSRETTLLNEGDFIRVCGEQGRFIHGIAMEDLEDFIYLYETYGITSSVSKDKTNRSSSCSYFRLVFEDIGEEHSLMFLGQCTRDITNGNNKTERRVFYKFLLLPSLKTWWIGSATVRGLIYEQGLNTP